MGREEAEEEAAGLKKKRLGTSVKVKSICLKEWLKLGKLMSNPPSLCLGIF